MPAQPVASNAAGPARASSSVTATKPSAALAAAALALAAAAFARAARASAAAPAPVVAASSTPPAVAKPCLCVAALLLVQVGDHQSGLMAFVEANVSRMSSGAPGLAPIALTVARSLGGAFPGR